MKKTNLSKKLQINKTTIVTLTHLQEAAVLGGVITAQHYCKTVYDLECPLTTIIGFNCGETEIEICGPTYSQC
ncbi:MAG TPA: class I lanthipeptide [Candidatus Kapabacteria bacterium]|nr:class I lanthipeptide [Candidatus Kapabacteria bacterium]